VKIASIVCFAWIARAIVPVVIFPGAALAGRVLLDAVEHVEVRETEPERIGITVISVPNLSIDIVEELSN
jgi:hypothetical protein